jgi:3-deoxy-7-phosphoheptulonate synthase
MMKACQDNGLVCTRMGAFKPRTSPYSFQGHGADCLPYVFESAGKHGIKVIAMEVMAPEHIEAIHKALEASGQPTGVMLQIGTRNCQNVSLLHAVGTQQDYPVLLKRGFGVSLHESLFAAEHIAAAGNCNMIFCLRGVKSIGAAPHRNLVDFGHISTIKRLTRLGVCADPSHSAGSRAPGVDGFSDIQQASAQAVISGVNMLLVDFHPQSDKALCDGHQALPVEQLPLFIQDMALCRQTYEQRCQLMDRNG